MSLHIYKFKRTKIYIIVKYFQIFFRYYQYIILISSIICTVNNVYKCERFRIWVHHWVVNFNFIIDFRHESLHVIMEDHEDDHLYFVNLMHYLYLVQ